MPRKVLALRAAGASVVAWAGDGGHKLALHRSTRAVCRDPFVNCCADAYRNPAGARHTMVDTQPPGFGHAGSTKMPGHPERGADDDLGTLAKRGLMMTSEGNAMDLDPTGSSPGRSIAYVCSCVFCCECDLGLFLFGPRLTCGQSGLRDNSGYVVACASCGVSDQH